MVGLLGMRFVEYRVTLAAMPLLRPQQWMPKSHAYAIPAFLLIGSVDGLIDFVNVDYLTQDWLRAT